MTKSAKPKKKYNPHKRAKVVVKQLTRQILVAWCPGYPEPICFNTNGDPLNIEAVDVKVAFMTKALPWSSHCLVLCRDQNKQQYIRSQELLAKGEYLYKDLAKPLNDLHQALLNGTNPQHRLNVGWVSSPAGIDVDIELADKIMIAMNAWDRPAKWEKKDDKRNAAESIKSYT